MRRTRGLKESRSTTCDEGKGGGKGEGRQTRRFERIDMRRDTFLFKRAVAPDIREGEDSHAHKAMGLKAGQVACRNKRNEEKKKVRHQSAKLSSSQLVINQ